MILTEKEGVDMNLSAPIQTAPEQRRLVRLSAPGPQLRLAVCVLGISLGFAVLFLLNSYAAYGPLMEKALSLVPEAFRSDLALQTVQYGSVTIALVIGYLLALVGLSGASVHWLTGATVAMERQVRALKSGDYTARVKLREGDAVHAELAKQLNELAAKLEQETFYR
jgi:hypothetical protein